MDKRCQAQMYSMYLLVGYRAERLPRARAFFCLNDIRHSHSHAPTLSRLSIAMDNSFFAYKRLCTNMHLYNPCHV
jgi:hypothetical protein